MTIERISASEMYDLLTKGLPSEDNGTTPVFDTLTDAYELARASFLLERADWELHVSDALDLFHEPFEPFDDLPAAMADCDQDVIDEQVTGWQMWALALTFGAVLGFIVWMAMVAA